MNDLTVTAIALRETGVVFLALLGTVVLREPVGPAPQLGRGDGGRCSDESGMNDVSDAQLMQARPARPGSAP